jgi:hypothetical protein
MGNKLSPGCKKLIALVLTASVLSVTLLAGTFAWKDHRQHKSNELSGRQKLYDVTLIEDFQPKDDWKVGDDPIDKEVRVKNTMDGTNPDAGAMFVRLTFKEYMEITAQTDYVHTPDRYAVGTDGKFIVSTDAPDETWLAAQGYPGHDTTLLTDAISGETGYFIKTRAGDPNGQYGKYVITDTGTTALPVPVVANTARVLPELLAQPGTHSADSNGECGYPAHNLSNPASGATFPIHEYVQWNHGASVVALSAFTGQRNVWVYNDVNPDDYYVYWIGALEPGETTANAFESVELIKQPDGKFYYAIHVDMEAVSEDQLSQWTDVPTPIFDALKGTTVTP